MAHRDPFCINIDDLYFSLIDQWPISQNIPEVPVNGHEIIEDVLNLMDLLGKLNEYKKIEQARENTMILMWFSYDIEFRFFNYIFYIVRNCNDSKIQLLLSQLKVDNSWNDLLLILEINKLYQIIISSRMI